MNASRLREIVDLLLAREDQSRVQTLLKEVNSHLTSLAGNLADANLQKQYSDALAQFQGAMNGLAGSFTPTEKKEIQEIGADRFFTADLVEQIRLWVLENPISPTVAQQKLGIVVKEREAYLQTIRQLQENLKKLSIEPQALQEGTAEIGFLIPRDLFKNELPSLIKELGVINRILRAFSEAATGTALPVTVQNISTSDPLFFFGLDPITVATLGAVVAWALGQWKKVEEIRKLRSETRKNSSFKPEEIKSFFDTKIEDTIRSAIDEKVGELIAQLKDGQGRINEQRNDLTWALQSLLARIERGMTIEIRALPPPKIEGEPETPAAKAFADITATVPQLVFPPSESAPVLELPPPEPPKLTKSGKEKE